MSVTPPLTSMLSGSERTVRGSDLAPESFHAFDDGRVRGWWVRAMSRDGTDTLAVIFQPHRAEADQWYCEQSPWADVEPEGLPVGSPMLDPFRCRHGGAAPVQDWYDAILMEDAQWRTSHRQQARWVGSDVEASLRRIELSISAYATEERAVASFGLLSELQAWIDEALAATTVTATAMVLRDLPYTRGVSRDSQILQRVENGEITGYLPVGVATNVSSQGWLTQNPAGFEPKPYAWLRTSGTEVIQALADAVQDLPALKREAVLREGVTSVPGADGWIVIAVPQAGVALPVPVGSSNLVIETDDDGATVSLRVLPSESREAHHRRRAAFEREWGRWLDPESPLSEADLAAGIARAESLVRDRLDLEGA